ncbi:hypothetical protein CR513_52398, partial [Mucuna pruriens]
MGELSDVLVKICNFNPKFALQSMFMALKRSPTTIDELRIKVIGYIQMKEIVESHNSVHAKQSLTPRNTKEHRHSEQNNEKKDETRVDPRTKISDFHSPQC